MNGLTVLVAVAACFYATYNLYDIAKARKEVEDEPRQ